jgi:transposase
MSNPRYPEEFKIQAVNQVTEKKLPVAEVAARLGVSAHSLYAWIKRYSKPQAERQQDNDQHAELCVVCEPNSSASLKSETY